MVWWKFGRRAQEGLADSLSASGAAGSGWDQVDGDYGFRRVGAAGSRREVPRYTAEKARTLSVHGYRVNPMARAIIDTYVAFCVGDSGVKLSSTSPEVEPFARRFWDDPRNQLGTSQEMLLRSHMLLGETAFELMVAEMSGATRIAYLAPESIAGVSLEANNPLWPKTLHIAQTSGQTVDLPIVQIDEFTELRTGDAMFWADWKAVVSDRRGFPFLGPVLDWLDAYDQVLWNLVDRTALARYMVWDVTVDGDQDDIDRVIAARGGTHVPRSGTAEFHNGKVTWKPMQHQTGAQEDRTTASAALTNLAAGAGLSKPWLADPEDANRATSLTMAEPVRRRVGGVQKVWLGHMTELVRFQIDQLVARGRIPATVAVVNQAGDAQQVPASETVRVLGPEIAASDAKLNAEILVNLSQALIGMRAQNLLSEDACRVAARKAWEEYVGVPYSHELDDSGDLADIEAYLEEQAQPATPAAVAAQAE